MKEKRGTYLKSLGKCAIITLILCTIWAVFFCITKNKNVAADYDDKCASMSGAIDEVYNKYLKVLEAKEISKTTEEIFADPQFQARLAWKTSMTVMRIDDSALNSVELVLRSLTENMKNLYSYNQCFYVEVYDKDGNVLADSSEKVYAITVDHTIESGEDRTEFYICDSRINEALLDVMKEIEFSDVNSLSELETTPTTIDMKQMLVKDGTFIPLTIYAVGNDYSVEESAGETIKGTYIINDQVDWDTTDYALVEETDETGFVGPIYLGARSHGDTAGYEKTKLTVGDSMLSYAITNDFSALGMYWELIVLAYILAVVLAVIVAIPVAVRAKKKQK